MHVHKKCLEIGPFYKEFILGAPKKCKRTLPVPGNSDRDLTFRLYNYCVFKGHYLAIFLGSQTTSERPLNDLWTTSGFQSEWPIAHKNPETADHSSHVRCVPSHLPDSNLFHRWVNFPSNTVKLFCPVSKWPRHGIVKKMLFPEKRNCWTKLSLRIWCSWKQLWCSSSNSSESSAET